MMEINIKKSDYSNNEKLDANNPYPFTMIDKLIEKFDIPIKHTINIGLFPHDNIKDELCIKMPYHLLYEISSKFEYDLVNNVMESYDVYLSIDDGDVLLKESLNDCHFYLNEDGSSYIFGKIVSNKLTVSRYRTGSTSHFGMVNF